MTVEADADRGEATITVPRDLLVVLRAEVRSAGAHWVQGFNAAGESLVRHDRRLSDGGCMTCALLAVINHFLYPNRAADEGAVVGR